MARKRYVKPSFFTSDTIGELPPLARLLFIGLWTQAERSGVLEYRPKHLKVTLLPYDDCNVEQLVAQLERHGFVYAFEAIHQGDTRKFLCINNFAHHQGISVGELRQPLCLPEPPPRTSQNVLERSEHVPNTSQNTSYLYSNSNSDSNSNLDATHPALSGTPLIALPLNDGSLHPVTQEDADKYAALYPNVDVMQQLRSMLGWLDSHPRKRKTKRGIRAFISGWLDREQNRNRNTHATHRTNQPAHGERVGFDPQQAVERRTELQSALDLAFAGMGDATGRPAQRPALIAAEARTDGTHGDGAIPPELHGRRSP